MAWMIVRVRGSVHARHNMVKTLRYLHLTRQPRHRRSRGPFGPRHAHDDPRVHHLGRGRARDGDAPPPGTGETVGGERLNDTTVADLSRAKTFRRSRDPFPRRDSRTFPASSRSSASGRRREVGGRPRSRSRSAERSATARKPSLKASLLFLEKSVAAAKMTPLRNAAPFGNNSIEIVGNFARGYGFFSFTLDLP